MPQLTVKICLVDEQNLMREALKTLLMVSEGIKVVFATRTGSGMQSKFNALPAPDRPKIVLYTINDLSTLDTVNTLRAELTTLKFFLIINDRSPQTIRKVLKTRPAGCVTRYIDFTNLVTAIKEVSRTGYFYSGEVLEHFLTSIDQQIEEQPDGVSLTQKEKDLVKLFGSELSYSEIAKSMNVSQRTIDTYRENIFQKLGVTTRVGVVVAGIKMGLIDID